MTGVKSYPGSRIGRCGWITSFLRESSRGYFAVGLLRKLGNKKAQRKFGCINLSSDKGSPAALSLIGAKEEKEVRLN